MSSLLFSPLELGGVTLPNRIVISPMCQYSAEDGCAGNWHIMHIGQFAVANPGLIMLEGTAVEAGGRISVGDLCLYTDEQEEALARLVAFVRMHSDARIGIQLFHSGRKGSRRTGKQGSGSLSEADGGWLLLGPSNIPYSDEYPVPVEASIDDLVRVENAFVSAAIRAQRAGIDIVELHYAHGYYLHTFLSALSNHRDDDYGGDWERRSRHPLDIFESVRAKLAASVALGARISGDDHGLEPGAWRLDDALRFGQMLVERGAAFLDVSSGYLSPAQHIPNYGPGFQVGLAERVRQETGAPTFTVGVITSGRQAETILRSGAADAIAIGRGALYNPRWPWHAAHELGETPRFPPQYQRVFDLGFPAMFMEGG